MRAGAVDGLCDIVWSFSLTDRLGRNGLDSFLLSLPGMGGGSSVLISALASAASALHDLARLIDFGRIEALLAIFVCSETSPAFPAAGVATFRGAEVDLGFESGSSGSGLFDAGRGVVGPFAKSICRTDLFRLMPLLVALTNNRYLMLEF